MFLDHIEIVDQMVTSRVYNPPSDLNEEKYKNLKDCKHFYVKARKDYDISVIEINKKSDKIIIMNHGNGSDNYMNYNVCKHLSDKLDVTVVCYDYIGYGLTKPERIPCERKCYDSIKSVVDHYINIYNQNNILLFGNSLGTGIIMEYITTNEWKYPVLLVSPFKSIQSIVSEYPIGMFFKHNKFESIEKVDKTQCPIKIIHGLLDELIHPDHSREIYEKMPNKKYEPLYLANANHGNILEHIDIQVIHEILHHSIE